MDAKTRILTAFRELVLSRPFDELKTRDVIDCAGVARSTFYANFRDRNDLLLQSAGPILQVLRGACDQTVSRQALQEVLEHVWENRGIGRLFFQPPLSTRLVRALLGPARRQPARVHFVINGLMGTIGAWVSGQLTATPSELAATLLRLSEALD